MNVIDELARQERLNRLRVSAGKRRPLQPSTEQKRRGAVKARVKRAKAAEAKVHVEPKLDPQVEPWLSDADLLANMTLTLMQRLRLLDPSVPNSAFCPT